MRFTVVLFDLDGTLIDSDAVILSWQRHTTRKDAQRPAQTPPPRL
jgi:beta-phosphoglucomutase-like phosphatase (HAD superfamily)